MRKLKKAQSSSVTTPDRLTTLPDQIRHHILSFLPMEDSIKASTLSKDWKTVTSSLLNLVFNQELYENKNPIGEDDFEKYVDRMLLNRDNRVDIQKLILTFRFDGSLTNTLHVNTWISFAIRNNLQELSLCDMTENFETLPCCLFNFTNLKVLELMGVCIRLPTVIGFPTLRKLRLMMVTFYDEGIIERLVLSSPVLEEMALALVHCYNLSNCTIESGTLRALHMWVYESPIQIKISTPNLQHIYFDSIESPPISSEILCSLSSAVLRIERLSSELLKGMTNLVKLTLPRSYIGFRFTDTNLYREQSPCSSLKILEIEIAPAERHWKVLMILLEICPNLVTLSITFMAITAGSLLNTEIPLKLFNRRMLKCLKTIRIVDFRGTKKELLIIRYFLKSANALDRMCIFYSSDEKENIETCRTTNEEILTYRKASLHAKIVFL